MPGCAYPATAGDARERTAEAGLSLTAREHETLLALLPAGPPTARGMARVADDPAGRDGQDRSTAGPFHL